MTAALIRKLLRDVRLTLFVVALLLALFQCLWAKITQRIVGDIVPFFNALAAAQGMSAIPGMPSINIQEVIFSGPGKVIRTLMGGETISIERAMDMMSIGYVHPLMQTLFCIWAIGRASGAIAGEIDRGTMELLLAQPVARVRLILAHLCVDGITIPLLCLSLWAGNWIGVWLVGPITPAPLDPAKFPLLPKTPVDPELLRVDPAAFGPALVAVGALMFAVSGYTMWLSAAGRFRWRVLGFAVFLTLVMFLVNVIGQMWEEVLGWLRPFTVFYYYQPQAIILGKSWCVDFSVWNNGHPLFLVPGPAVLLAVGGVGYAMALWTLHRRDLPAPL
jgi:ABC-2 type transport system permease protein